MDSVAGEEGARIAEETQLDIPDLIDDNCGEKFSDEYQLKDETRLCDVWWCLEERHDTARQWLYRFPGCIFSVSTAAIEVEQSTPAFKTARTLARMLSKQRLIERQISLAIILFNPVAIYYFYPLICHVWCPFAPVSNHVKRLRGSVQSKTPERLVAEIVEAWLLSQHMKQCHYIWAYIVNIVMKCHKKSFFENRESCSYLFQL